MRAARAPTHPEDRARSEAALQRLRGGEATRHSEPLRLRHRDGLPIACQVYLARVDSDGVRGPLLCQLHPLAGAPPPQSADPPGPGQPETRLLLEQIGDNLPAGCLFQARGNELAGLHLLYLGAEIERLTELTPNAILGDPSLLMAQLDRSEQRRLMNAFLAAQRDHGPVELELRHTVPSGRSCWLHLRATPSRPPGSCATVWNGVALDITERSVAPE